MVTNICYNVCWKCCRKRVNIDNIFCTHFTMNLKFKERLKKFFEKCPKAVQDVALRHPVDTVEVT